MVKLPSKSCKHLESGVICLWGFYNYSIRQIWKCSKDASYIDVNADYVGKKNPKLFQRNDLKPCNDFYEN